jgi:hypothetical protein
MEYNGAGAQSQPQCQEMEIITQRTQFALHCTCASTVLLRHNLVKCKATMVQKWAQLKNLSNKTRDTHFAFTVLGASGITPFLSIMGNRGAQNGGPKWGTGKAQ